MRNHLSVLICRTDCHCGRHVNSRRVDFSPRELSMYSSLTTIAGFPEQLKMRRAHVTRGLKSPLQRHAARFQQRLLNNEVVLQVGWTLVHANYPCIKRIERMTGGESAVLALGTVSRVVASCVRHSLTYGVGGTLWQGRALTAVAANSLVSFSGKFLWQVSLASFGAGNRNPVGFFLSNLVAYGKMNNGGVSVYSPIATSLGYV